MGEPGRHARKRKRAQTQRATELASGCERSCEPRESAGLLGMHPVGSCQPTGVPRDQKTALEFWVSQPQGAPSPGLDPRAYHAPQ